MRIRIIMRDEVVEAVYSDEGIPFEVEVIDYGVLHEAASDEDIDRAEEMEDTASDFWEHAGGIKYIGLGA